MRLYLSSYKFGNKSEYFFDLIKDKNSKIAIIANSADLYSAIDVEDRVNQDISFFDENSYTAEQLDLREYFGKEDELEEAMQEYGAVWVRGANVFVLRRAFEYSGFDNIIKKRLNEDSIVYGGYSAGACVMGDTLHGLELCDDAYTVPFGYEEEVIWEGLGILPYAIVPHYDSDHPESGFIDEVVTYLYENDIPHEKLRDGEAIVMNGNVEEIL
jgi:dipeptidase E